MTIDQFYEWLKRTVAECRGKTYDPKDATLVKRITHSEAAAILRRSSSRVYRYVSDGYLKRENMKSAYYAEFDASEVVRCARLIGLIKDPTLASLPTHNHYGNGLNGKRRAQRI